MLIPGQNCAKLSHTSRSAVLVDAKEYFEAIAWAAERAEHSLHILSWDIDSRISLRCEDASETLGDFLVRLLENKPGLHIRILTWDFVFFYANEREKKSEAIRRFSRHPRLHFEFDRRGPFLISHHQKIVVADDQLGFCGGLDLTQRRWDTPAHELDEPRRTDPTGQTYEPFHDVQMMVEGEAARELGNIFRERWRLRTGEILPETPSLPNPALWPSFISSLFTDLPVAISRTIPEGMGVTPIRECAELFFDSLRQAKDYIYIENQYLTSRTVGDILIERLKEENPPEILILIRNHDSKWTEAFSMSALRSRLLRRIIRQDKKGRLLVACPFASKKRDVSINLHSKVFISDDRILRVGSANLCGRSEGMDTECDLTFEVEKESDRARIRGFRNRLLAEHLGLSEEEVEKELISHSSLLSAIRALQGRSDRSIEPCPLSTFFFLEWVAPRGVLVDPESPRQFTRGIIRIATFALAIALLFLYWPSLQALFSRENIIVATRWVNSQPLAPFGLMLLFTFLASVGIPLLPLVLAYALVLPPLETFLYTLIGAVLSANGVYFLARRIHEVRPIGFFSRLLEGERFRQLQDILAREGIWPLLLLRLTPVAPFWIENFCMGAIRIPFWHFFLSSTLGLLPGLWMISYFEDQVSASNGQKAALLLYSVLFVLVGWALQKGIRHFVDQRATNVNGG